MAYIILEKIEASQHIETIVAGEDLTNGQFVTLGEMAEIENGGEAIAVTEMVEGDTDIVLHASDALVYEDNKGEVDFVLKAGKAGRGYRLKDGNQVAFSEDLVTGTGKFAVPTGAGVELVAEKPQTGIYGRVFDVFEDVNIGEMTSIKFVIK